MAIRKLSTGNQLQTSILSFTLSGFRKMKYDPEKPLLVFSFLFFFWAYGKLKTELNIIFFL